jgi:hypothetical protein
MAYTSGPSEGSHDADDLTAGTAVAPEVPGVSGCGVPRLGAIAAEGSVAGLPVVPGAVERAAGREVAAVLPTVAPDSGADRVTSTFAVPRPGVFPSGRGRQPDNKTSAQTSRTGMAVRAQFLKVLGWVDVDIPLLLCEWLMAFDVYHKILHTMAMIQRPRKGVK